MKKNQAILILISIFVVSAALGVGGTWAVKKLGANNPVAINDPNVFGGGGSVSVEENKPTEQEKAPSPVPTPTPSQEYTPKQKEPAPHNNESRGQKPLEVDVVVSGEDAQYEQPLGEPKDMNMPTANITLVSTTGPTPNPETRTYSFTATASGGWGQYTYYLYPTRNAQDTLVSTSGHFTNVAPSSSGKYMLVIKDRTGKELTKEIRGFTAILNKLTTQQLTTRLSKSTPDQGLGKYFASGYKIKFTGLNSGDPVPTSYTQIYSNIASGYWSKVKVTAVEFNGYNKITKITVSVYYN